MGAAVGNAWHAVTSARIAAPVLLIAWLYLGYKVIRGGYLQDSWVKARGYMRTVKLSC